MSYIAAPKFCRCCLLDRPVAVKKLFNLSGLVVKRCSQVRGPPLARVSRFWFQMGQSTRVSLAGFFLPHRHLGLGLRLPSLSSVVWHRCQRMLLDWFPTRQASQLSIFRSCRSGGELVCLIHSLVSCLEFSMWSHLIVHFVCVQSWLLAPCQPVCQSVDCYRCPCGTASTVL